MTPDSKDHALLEVDDLATHFLTKRGTVHAVNGVSLSVRQGELVGVVGESGCGKTVMLRSILRLVRPPGRIVSGTVRLDGVDLLDLPLARLRQIRGAQIGFVGQNPFGALNPVLTIRNQFANAVRAHRELSVPEINELARQTLSDVGIREADRVLDGYAHELSGGMAQRAVIGIVLSLSPRIILADEPTTALDVTVQRQLLDLLVRLMREQRRSLLIVTHDLGVVAQYCQRVMVMYAGKIVEAGRVADVFGQPAHPYTKALLRAVPRPGKKLTELRGTVPDLINYPIGCPFASRCDSVHDACTAYPAEHVLGSQWRVACHLYAGAAAQPGSTGKVR